MQTKIIELICNEVKKYAGIQIDDINLNLLDPKLGINPAIFLYILEELEEKCGVPVYKIFEQYDYRVLSVKNLADAIIKLNQ